ncbi:MAG: sensor histidine kinase [Rhodobacteraceae bacterium]|nr:MAG: sensor histidine kinase [Paracoccaceae bacterium]
MGRSLTQRLVFLTLVAVLAMEALIFVPAVARFRLDWLTERLAMAQLASLAILATPEGALDDDLERELLDRAGAASIVLRRDGTRALVLSALVPKPIDATYDIRAPATFRSMLDVMVSLNAPEGRHIRVIGRPDPSSLDEVEITLDEAPLRAALWLYAQRIFWLSLIVSLPTAVLIFTLVHFLLVRPMKRIVGNMAHFREDPEDLMRVIQPRSRVSEIADAERELNSLQTQVRDSLRERARLAALGEAVAKIAHDLRNMLASAQLMAERFEASRDPLVRRVGPKLIGSLDRAIALCESTLRFGRAEEAAPVTRRVALSALVDDAGENIFPEHEPDAAIRFENRVPPEMLIDADPDQMFRVFTNLIRNARQAFESAGRGGVVTVEARHGDACAEIDVADDGPGMPTRALENLFQPFRGGARKDGSGLGLAIAHELVAMQGGRLTLASSTTRGTRFRITLPA